jgi:DNA-3-methyladenine glycosylase II
LMFSLQRRDIFPANDLALQVALQRLKGLQQRPSEKQARELIRHWSPWRSAGSLFLWHYYRGAPT